MRILVGFSQAVATEQKDFGVLHEPVGDRGSNGGVVENVAPLGEGCVGGDNGRALVTMARRDDLIEEVRSLLIERQVAQLVADKQSWFGVDLELANQGMVHLRSRELIQHVHGGGEEHALIGLAGPPADDFCQECFSHARIADKNRARAFGQKLQIQQAQDTVLQLHAALVMLEVEAINRVLRLQA